MPKKTTATGGSSQDRRRTRRELSRNAERLTAEDLEFIQSLADQVAHPVELAATDESIEDAEYGGKPSRGTTRDRRLKDNKTPEQAAIDLLEEFQHGTSCECGHALGEHSGAGGTCAHSDGRGTCRCGAFAETSAEDSTQSSQEFRVIVDPVGVLARLRPEGSEPAEIDLEEIRAAVADRGLYFIAPGSSVATITAAAGDVAWGPEDGFVDLLCDVNEILGAMGSSEMSYPYPRAVDASVKLDKVLICEDDDYFVAPISVGPDGEPTLADRSEWVSVEEGWIESADDDSMAASGRMRIMLRDFVLTADGATAPPIPEAHEPGERMPERTPSPAAPPSETAASTSSYGWEAIFVPEAVLTDDGRAFAPDSVEWRDLPLSLAAMLETADGHDGATVCGRIDRIWRDGSLIRAAGVFATNEFSMEIAQMVGDGVLRGLSVDIAALEREIGPRSDWFDADGNWIAVRDENGEWTPPGGRAEEGAPDLWDMLNGDTDAIVVVTKGVIGMATVCPFPAFAEANIALTASGELWTFVHDGRFSVVRKPIVAAAALAVEETPAEETEIETVEIVEEVSDLTASAAGHAPLRPPAEWFADPELEELTALTITDDGRIFGHAWSWNSCHISFPDACVTAPHSQTDYVYFHLGEIECENGERVAVGKVTLDAPHAGQRLSRVEATSHYDHTGTVAAHISCGEDEHGGWFAGAIAPDLSDEKLRLLRGSALSGDWRGVNGNLELVALLAVNVPGFPVPRARALVASGADGRSEVVALTAAGIVLERTEEDDFEQISEIAADAETEALAAEISGIADRARD